MLLGAQNLPGSKWCCFIWKWSVVVATHYQNFISFFYVVNIPWDYFLKVFLSFGLLLPHTRTTEDVHMCIKLPWTYTDFRKEKSNKNTAWWRIPTLYTSLSSSCGTHDGFTDSCRYPDGSPEMSEVEDSIKDRFFCRQTSCYKGLIKSCYNSKC